MAKPTKTREELITEANRASKPAAPTAEEAKEQELDELEKMVDTPDPELPGSAAAVAQAIIGGDEGASTTDAEFGAAKAAEEAVRLLQHIFAGYSPTAPNEHIIFGNGGGKFTLGHYRALMKVIPTE